MSVLMTMSIMGNTDVIGNLDKVSAQAQDAIAALIVQATEGTYTDSQDTVAVDTGELKDSGYKVTSTRNEGLVGYGTDHCWYVELGTSKMAAQPYLLPAFLTWGDWLKQELQGLF